jgi:hypothetical protein
MKKWQIILTVVIAVLAVLVFIFFSWADMYSSQVVATEAGGTIGMAPFTDRIDFGDIPLGKGVTKTVIMTNNGNNDNTIKVFVLGSIAQLIDVEPGKSFTLKAGETVNLNFRLTMPASAPVGKKFSGRIIILTLP